MKRLFTLILMLAFIAGFSSMNAQYTGLPFYPDTTFIFPGDYFWPTDFDRGDSAVVFSIGDGTDGSGGANWRADRLIKYYGSETDMWGKYFLNNGGNKTMRMAPDTSNLYFTVTFSEAGYYKGKNWNQARNTRVYLYSHPDMVAIDTMDMLMTEADTTGEQAAFAGREWYNYPMDSINVAAPGKYIIQLGIGSAAISHGNEDKGDARGLYSFYTSEQLAAGEDVKLATVTIDEPLVDIGGSVEITSDMDGMLWVLTGAPTNGDSRDFTKGLAKPLLFADSVKTMAITAGDVVVDVTGWEAGKYSAVVVSENGNVSVATSFDIIYPEVVLVNYDSVTIGHTDSSTHMAGEIWSRNSSDLVALEVIPVADAPAGYSETDSVLKVTAGTYADWWHGLMFEFTDTVKADLEPYKYLHIAYYIPEKNVSDNGVIRNWLKSNGDPKWQNGDKTYYVGETNNWVDLVYDVSVEADSIDGLMLDHFEFFGHPRDTVSYIGSVVMSRYAEPRFENAGDPVDVLTVKVSSDAAENRIESGMMANMATEIRPVNATDQTVTWSLGTDPTGSSIDAAGVLTAGNTPGDVEVIATANDGSGIEGKLTLTVWKAQTLVDYSMNQITHTDSTKVAGDIYARSASETVALEIIPLADAPAGYDLTDSVLKVTAGQYTNWYDGLMFEFNDTFTVDLANYKYLHVAYYLPIKTVDNDGAIRNWLKGSGTQRWNNKATDWHIGQTNAWVDLVYDITNDTIDGLKIDHFEFMGYPEDTVSYIGSIILSPESTPRFVNVGDPVHVLKIGVTSDASGDSVAIAGTANMVATILPDNATDKTVTWSVDAADTTGSSISSEGVLTAGADAGKVMVIATANDGSAKTGARTLTVWDPTVGVSDRIADAFSIYPNPVSTGTALRVDLSSLNENAEISVLSISGQVLYRTLGVAGTINVISGDAFDRAGIYFIRVQSGEINSVGKVIVK